MLKIGSGYVWNKTFYNILREVDGSKTFLLGAGGGYMFSGRPSVPLSVRASVRPFVIHVVVLCFRDISSICWRIFAKLLSLVHLGTQMSW